LLVNIVTILINYSCYKNSKQPYNKTVTMANGGSTDDGKAENVDIKFIHNPMHETS
jgi:hypothetical protein